MDNIKLIEKSSESEEKKSIKIGNFILNSQVSLAPMAGITDLVLRRLVRKYSKTALLTTEMISSEALVNNKEAKIAEVFKDKESPICCQLSGHKPYIMSKAAKILEDRADIIDINMGCPVKKVFNGKDGCALMTDFDLACDIVKSIKDVVNIPVSVKCRLGINQDQINFVEFAKKMELSGADFITIHGRTKKQMYSGNADWGIIKLLKNEISIPYFANGDIKTIEDAKNCLDSSEAFGVAIGRGILFDPSLIFRIEQYLNFNRIIPPLNILEKIDILKEFLDQEMTYRGTVVGLKFMRKYYPYYINSLENAAQFRSRLVVEEDYNKIFNILDEIKLTYG